MKFSSLIPVAWLSSSRRLVRRLTMSPPPTPFGFRFTPTALRPATQRPARPATTPPLSPGRSPETIFTLPDGFEIRLFAPSGSGQPRRDDLGRRGRLWGVGTLRISPGRQAGAKPRDRIKILEDTMAMAKPQKSPCCRWLNLATGLQLGYGGVFVGQRPIFCSWKTPTATTGTRPF